MVFGLGTARGDEIFLFPWSFLPLVFCFVVFSSLPFTSEVLTSVFGMHRYFDVLGGFRSKSLKMVAPVHELLSISLF